MEARSGVGGSVAERIGRDFQELRHQLRSNIRSPAHALTQPAQVDTEGWGFAKVPPLEELFRRAAAAEQQQQAAAAREQLQGQCTRHESSQDPSTELQTEAATGHALQPQHKGAAGDSQQGQASASAHEAGGTGTVLHTEFLEALCSSSAFRSPHCEAALASLFHVQEHFDGLAGSVCLPVIPEEQAEHARGAIKQHISAAWSSEAVRCGVGCSKAGNYDEAVRYYNRALELNDSNADAYVARGAAKANQQLLREAAEDFQFALKLDPSSRNAARYLDAVQNRMTVASQEEQQQPSPPPRGQCHEAEVADVAQQPGMRHLTTGTGLGEAAQLGEQREGNMLQLRQPNCAKAPQSSQPAVSGATSRSSHSMDDSGTSSDGVSLRDEDIRRALEIMSKARSAEKHGRSKHRKHKGKSKKSKSKHKSGSKKKKRRRTSP